MDDASYERQRSLWRKDVSEWSGDDLAWMLAERYKPSEIPPCRVCGGPLSIGAIGGGEPTRWACSGQEEDPDNPGRVRYKPGRSVADDHYGRSEWVDRRQGGDSAVMELIARFRAFLATPAAAWLRAGSSEPISDALKRADPEFYQHHTIPLVRADGVRASGLAHEVWAAAQLAPGEGIEDGVARVQALLASGVAAIPDDGATVSGGQR